MVVIEVLTGKTYPIEIIPVLNSDYKLLSKSRYHFDWKEERNQEVYKLVLEGQNEILGLISIERFPDEWRVHIRLLTVSKENVGSKKRFENIAGHLFSHVAKIAVFEHGELACISLRPKSSIAAHYMNK